MSSIDDQIAAAAVEVAKGAIAKPEMYPQWYRLREAKRNLIAAYAQLDAAQEAWDALIAPAPDEWKQLAPIPE